jgi:Fis family transcriptional regulator, factor for inversion stimulation protein
MSKKDHRRVPARQRGAVLQDLRGAEPHGCTTLFLHAAEKPLLDVVMRHAEGNQSKAAEWLGINRNTCGASCSTTS